MDRILFLKKFIDEPKKIGSLTPSSRFLVRKMLDGLSWENFSHVAELGAGTGIFTEQIIKRKTHECKQMKNMLNEYFSSVKIDFFLLNFPPAFVYFCRK